MNDRSAGDPSRRARPLLLGALTFVAMGLLIVWDVAPGWFPIHAHNVLGALPLALIAIAYLVHRWRLRPTRAEALRALLLAAAFLFWAANQLWPDLPQATLLNDVAVILFVLDVLLGMREAKAVPSPLVE
jgi:hypothetical protein